MAIVGRDTFADIVLPFPQVSARHAYIEPLGGDFFRIVDLGSSNGTFVGGQRIDQAKVRRGDDVRFGTVPLDWRAAAARLDPDAAMPPGVIVGREPGCDVVVADPRVSGRHARIVPQGETLMVLDLGSANGLSVNGQAVSRAVVSRSDRVSLGSLPVDLFALVQKRAAPARPVVPIAARPPAPAPMPAPPAPPVAVAPSPPARSRPSAWVWAAVVFLMIVAGGTGALFATRQDLVKRCAVGGEDVFRERVFFFQVADATARAQRAPKYCPKHGEELVPYTKIYKCTYCKQEITREQLQARRMDEHNPVEEIFEGVHPGSCELKQGVKDFTSGVGETIMKGLDVLGGAGR